MNEKGTVLLTGGNGMVGRNILEHSAAKEWKIIAPSRLDLDLSDYIATKSFVKEITPDIIIHAAGYVGGIQANIEHPVEFLVKNVDIGRNIILAAYETGVFFFFNLGSSCMYPRNLPNPLSEDMILTGELEPTNEGYALAKIMTTKLCEYITRENPDYLYKTIIPCNLYGRHDNFDPQTSHLIPAIIHKIYCAIKNGIECVEIWSDGKARREFMFAGDFADAMICAINQFEKIPMLMNIGLGNDYSIDHYYKVVGEVMGFSGEFSYDLSKPVGMKQKLVSNKLQLEWGWRPKVSLQKGIEETCDYYKQKFEQ